MRTMSLLRALVDGGHAVTFVSYVSPKQEAETLRVLASMCAKVKLVPEEFAAMSTHKGVWPRLAALATFKTYAIERFRDERMRTSIREQLQGGAFDAVFADSLYALANLPATKTPILLNCHNVEWRILDRYAGFEGNVLKRLYVKVEGHRLRRVEELALKESAACMVCSGQDGEFLDKVVEGKKIYVVPNCIDTARYAPDSTEAGSEFAHCTLLFQGGMDWYPNRDAVEYFTTAILPAVRKQMPKTRFVVAGRNPPEGFIQRISAKARVEFTGTVPDMRPYLAKATLAVVPLRIGSGTRLKILEAAAAGLAIVSTSLGAEGLEFRPGQEILLEDEPQRFADAVVALLRDAARRQAIGRAARHRVVERYSFACLRDQVCKCVSETIQGASQI